MRSGTRLSWYRRRQLLEGACGGTRFFWLSTTRLLRRMGPLWDGGIRESVPQAQAIRSTTPMAAANIAGPCAASDGLIPRLTRNISTVITPPTTKPSSPP